MVKDNPIVVINTNICGTVLKTYTEPPKIAELEADLLSAGWLRGLLLANRQSYILLGLRYGVCQDADFQIQIRPLDWLPQNSASPYQKTHIFVVRKYKDVAEQLEDGELLLINDLYDDEVYILSQLELTPLGTISQTDRLTLQITGGWFQQRRCDSTHTHLPQLTP